MMSLSLRGYAEMIETNAGGCPISQR